MSQGALLVTARWLSPRPGDWIDGGGLCIERGLVRRVVRGRSAVRRARRECARQLDLDACALVPGLVNAHAHLELSGFEGALPRSDFRAWIEALLTRRATLTALDMERDAARGLARCVETGTTTVGDIDSSGAVPRAFARARGRGPVDGARAHWPRVVLHRELLDAGDPRRTELALHGVRRALPRRERLLEGLSPHAPHTTSEALRSAAASLAERRGIPLAVHWAETREEVEWLERGTGPFAALLGESPRCTGSELLERTGLLGPRTALIHGNLPRRGELARVAKSGATLVHCPGCHAFFGREPFPLARYLAVGVPVALGTDSLASNDDLDLYREMGLFRAAFGRVSPEEAWAAATTNGARALGLRGRAGELVPGAWADFAAHSADEASGPAVLERLTAGAPSLTGVWCGGRLVAGRAT